MNYRWVKVNSSIPTVDGVYPLLVENKKYTLVINEGNLYIFQSKCPHAGGSLYTGWCEKNKLICPIHRYSYDLESGKGSAGQGDYITKFPLKWESGNLFVGLKASWWKKLFS